MTLSKINCSCAFLLGLAEIPVTDRIEIDRIRSTSREQMNVAGHFKLIKRDWFNLCIYRTFYQIWMCWESLSKKANMSVLDFRTFLMRLFLTLILMRANYPSKTWIPFGNHRMLGCSCRVIPLCKRDFVTQNTDHGANERVISAYEILWSWL